MAACVGVGGKNPFVTDLGVDAVCTPLLITTYEDSNFN
jgi:hypothetical protein